MITRTSRRERMKNLPRTFVALLLLAAVSATAAQPVVWTFESDTVDRPPGGFSFARTGDGKTGRWLVRSDPDAPSGPKVLAQTDADDTDYRFPVAVASGPLVKDLRLSVRCKTTSGKIDQVCGLVFRYRDENNYYVTRTNALENNVRLYHVRDGRRVQFAGWNGKVAKNAWHDLVVEARGEHFQVFFNGRRVIDAQDPTFSAPGKVGVWTKADSLTLFDQLTVTPLEGPRS